LAERGYIMRIISLDSIKGNELLAKDIYNAQNALLIPAGTIVKKEYIHNLRQLNIDYIYVEDDLAEGVDLSNSLDFQIKEQCQDTVKEILLKYSYQKEDELQEIKNVADEIISDIMKEPEVIYNLSSIRYQSDSTYSHSLNVCALSVIIAFKLKLPRKKIREIAIGCLLHDIGIAYISPDILNKPIDIRSENDIQEYRRHIIYGYSVVENMKWLSPIAKDIIIYHHERLDGSGYPFHLTGDRIKIGPKIAGLCDDFDSKVYGNHTSKIKVHDAIEYVISEAGRLFDYKVVKAFISSVAAYPTGSIVITNEGEKGIVLRQNIKCPTRPVIRIIEDKSGQKPEQFIERDLTKELTLFIEDTVSL
jgi:HD-GYP domain-containing protein (c-di-GMP phosphodiesterase class II)